MPFEIKTLTLTPPVLCVQGGAGNYVTTHTPEQLRERGEAIWSILHAAYGVLAAPPRVDAPGGSARAAVLAALAGLELEPRFNAGRGSAIQRDGRIAVSAAIMDGRRTRLSAIYNARDCLHPSQLCDVLLDRPDPMFVPERFFDTEGAAELMRELGIPEENLETERQLQMFAKRRRWLDSGESPAVGAPDEEHAAVGSADEKGGAAVPRGDGDAGPDADDQHGTVGAIAIDLDGNLFAGTSTGGRGFEHTGRVSDTPMPAGTYACPAVALSATGVGEFIVDMNLCGRVATRVLDGFSLTDAVAKTFQEAEELETGTTRDGKPRGSSMGLVALTPDGTVVIAHSTEAIGAAARGQSGETWLDAHSRAPVA